jgi:hypothetical protein
MATLQMINIGYRFSNAIKYNLTSCPLQQPFVNYLTGDCFDCPTGLKFNLGTKLCEGCPNGQQYNLTDNDCESICNSTQIFNSTTQKC